MISHGSTESIAAESKRVRWRDQWVEYQHDPRNVGVECRPQQTMQGSKTREGTKAVDTDRKLPGACSSVQIVQKKLT